MPSALPGNWRAVGVSVTAFVTRELSGRQSGAFMNWAHIRMRTKRPISPGIEGQVGSIVASKTSKSGKEEFLKGRQRRRSRVRRKLLLIGIFAATIIIVTASQPDLILAH